MDKRRFSRGLFKTLNALIVLPAFRIGLGKLISNPITGHIMILKMSGRRTGKIRYAPLGYTIIDGRIYCYQGRRLKGQWYLNIMKNPEVEVLLPNDRIRGFAEAVADQKEAANAIRQILKSSGLGGFVYGFNPFTASDEMIIEMIRDIPVVRITPITDNTSLRINSSDNNK